MATRRRRHYASLRAAAAVDVSAAVPPVVSRVLVAQSNTICPYVPPVLARVPAVNLSTTVDVEVEIPPAIGSVFAVPGFQTVDFNPNAPPAVAKAKATPSTFTIATEIEIPPAVARFVVGTATNAVSVSAGVPPVLGRIAVAPAGTISTTSADVPPVVARVFARAFNVNTATTSPIRVRAIATLTTVAVESIDYLPSLPIRSIVVPLEVSANPPVIVPPVVSRLFTSPTTQENDAAEYSGAAIRAIALPPEEVTAGVSISVPPAVAIVAADSTTIQKKVAFTVPPAVSTVVAVPLAGKPTIVVDIPPVVGFVVSVASADSPGLVATAAPAVARIPTIASSVVSSGDGAVSADVPPAAFRVISVPDSVTANDTGDVSADIPPVMARSVAVPETCSEDAEIEIPAVVSRVSAIQTEHQNGAFVPEVVAKLIALSGTLKTTWTINGTPAVTRVVPPAIGLGAKPDIPPVVARSIVVPDPVNARTAEQEAADLKRTRREGTQERLILAIVDRLIQQIPILNDSTCFVSDFEVPDEFPPTGDVFCTVCIGEGNFPDEFFAGGGPVTTTEASTVVVTICARSNLDSTHRREVTLLTHEKAILTQLKPMILAALTSNEMEDGTRQPWEPQIDGAPVLREPMQPVRATRPAPISGESDWYGVSITFRTLMDWDFTRQQIGIESL